MNSLSKTDLNSVIGRLPKDVQNLLRTNKIFLAGGFIRAIIAGEKARDIDLFGESKDSLKAIAYKFASDRKVKVHETDNALTLLNAPRLSVQFITRWLYSRPEDLAASFDFTICQAVIWFDPESKLWNNIISEGFYPDLAARRLVYTMPRRNEDAGGSILRVRKFITKGYNIQAQSLARVIARLVLGIRNREGQWDEKWLGDVITSLLREVDPLIVVDGVEMVNEHEVVEGIEEVKNQNERL
jgi:hypothetical protein